MDKLGAVAGSLTTRSHLQKRSDRGEIAPITDAAQVPASYVREVDRNIIDAVAWSWKGTGDHGPHSPTLRRELTQREQKAIGDRLHDLHRAIEPFRDTDRTPLSSRINDMLRGFPQLRSLDQRQALAMSVGFLTNVRNQPPWAIARACDKIADGSAGINTAWPPTEAQFHEIVRELVAPYRERIAKLTAFRDAPVDPPLPVKRLTKELKNATD